MNHVDSNLLQSRDHGELLDLIDLLRSQGLHDHVQLPQIVVCGDQSSGKSSVLDASSGVHFPTKDNLCTRFATELILCRAAHVGVNVSINPGSRRSEDDKAKLSGFRYPNATLENVPAIIETAKDAMGIASDARAFSDDILRIEVVGPNQPHLTLVDLTGLIHSQNKQQSAEDVQLVLSLVKFLHGEYAQHNPGHCLGQK